MTHRLTQHRLVVVLKAIGIAEDRDQPSIDLTNDLLLLGRVPIVVSVVAIQDLQCFVIVNGIDRGGKLELSIWNVFGYRCLGFLRVRHG